MTIRVLGIDPGLAHCGLAILDGVTVVEAHTFVTKPSTKKQHVHVSHDTIRRARELSGRLRYLMMGIHIVAIEGISMPRHASSAGKLCLAFGVIASLCESLGLPLIQFSPQEVKAYFGTKKGKDTRVEKAMEMYPHLFKGTLAEWREHMADAIGVAHLATRDSMYLAMRQHNG